MKNRYQFIGHLGNDAEVRLTESGFSAISFSVAVTEKWTDRNGQAQSRTEWVRCTLWRKPDKTGIAQYLKKGTKVAVEGKPTARGYITPSTGEPAASLEVRVDDLELCGGSQGQGGSSYQQPQSPEEMFQNHNRTEPLVPATQGKAQVKPAAPPATPPAQQQPNTWTNHMGQKVDNDDLPF